MPQFLEKRKDGLITLQPFQLLILKIFTNYIFMELLTVPWPEHQPPLCQRERLS